LEYNGMWDIQMVYQNLPPGWDLYQTVTTINAETYELYLKNFGSKVIQQVGISELVIFNRCTPTLKEYIRSTNVVAMNPRAIIFLEDHDGDSENYTENLTLPYDITSDTIQLEDHDFGTFYVDITQDPSRYHGKTVKTKALVHKLTNQDSAYHDSNRFSAGRFAMVCCADDITYISVFCDMPQADKIVQERSWADITAYIDLEFNEQLQEEMAVLKITAYAPAEPPKDDLIYFR
ncbi:MAG: hypothetical protein IKV96_03260, partial [Firmicutes bacterium]|nr:hypothetical protein [Bacillota bacterium]